MTCTLYQTLSGIFFYKKDYILVYFIIIVLLEFNSTKFRINYYFIITAKYVFVKNYCKTYKTYEVLWLL